MCRQFLPSADLSAIPRHIAAQFASCDLGDLATRREIITATHALCRASAETTHNGLSDPGPCNRCAKAAIQLIRNPS